MNDCLGGKFKVAGKVAASALAGLGNQSAPLVQNNNHVPVHIADIKVSGCVIDGDPGRALKVRFITTEFSQGTAIFSSRVVDEDGAAEFICHIQVVVIVDGEGDRGDWLATVENAIFSMRKIEDVYGLCAAIGNEHPAVGIGRDGGG